jgi:hypothetical protein
MSVSRGSTIQLRLADQERSSVQVAAPEWRRLLVLAVKHGWIPAGARVAQRESAYVQFDSGDIVDGGALSGYTSGTRIEPEDCHALAKAWERVLPFTGGGIIYRVVRQGTTHGGVDLG